MIFATKGYIEFCERQIQQQREDFLERLREKDSEIRRLRAELAGRARIEPETMAMTGSQAAAALRKQSAEVVQFPQGPQDWQGELSELLKDQEEKVDGI
jgi:hypothetical protein